MNLFVVHRMPAVAARQLCDQHVHKMVLETAQLLCTAAHLAGHRRLPYGPTHVHHPLVAWVGAGKANWAWTLAHGRALSREYHFRYGTYHAAEQVIDIVSGLGPTSGWLLSPFLQCMPEQYRHWNAVTAYRNYYCAEKVFARWNHGRPAPAWWRRGT